MECHPGDMGYWNSKVCIFEVNGFRLKEAKIMWIGMFDPEPGKQVEGFLGWTKSSPCSCMVLHEEAVDQAR